MVQIFISYSREDLTIAEKIIDALAKNDLEPWIDWKSIPKGEMLESEILQGIENAEIFLFLVSPDSVRSDWCSKEIAHAIENGKRILPIVIRDTDPKTTHSEISKRNWIFCRVGQDDFNKAIEETQETIHTDYEWVKYHRALQEKALIWQSQKDDESLFLRGKELEKAEQKLAIVDSNKDPQPTDLQKGYIAVSRQEAERKRKQRYRTYAIIVLLILVASMGSFYGVIQSNRITPLRNENLTKQAQVTIEANANATAQAHAATQSSANATVQAQAETQSSAKATAQALAETQSSANATAQALASTQSSANATAQALAATQVSANATAQKKVELETVISRSQELASQSIREREKSFDLSILLSVEAFQINDNAESRSALFDATFINPQLIQYLYKHTDSVNSVAFSPDGKILATTSFDTTIDLWNTESHQLISTLSEKNGQGKCLAFSPDGKILVQMVIIQR